MNTYNFGSAGMTASVTPAQAKPAMGAEPLIKDTTSAGFRQDVIAESMQQPVLVDFWAPWCGPCKQLTPMLEKAVNAAGGRVRLVKMNIDEHPQIAGQLGIKSIPAVIAFDKGQPVDGFMGAVPEAQIAAFIEALAGPAPASPLDALLADAMTRVEAGDAVGAAERFAAVLTQDPLNVIALTAMARLHLDSDDLDGARRFLAMIPPEKAEDPAVAGLRSAIELAEQAAELGDLAELEAKLDADAGDHQARFDLALALNGHGRRDEALDHLLEIVRRDRTWNEDGARKQILQFFEAWGPMDEATIAGRRKLSTLLFA